MVLKGQFLERPTLIPVGPHVMEGVSHRGKLSPLLLVLSPPPEDGGGMDTVVGAELAYAASAAGHPTLRFNYRGVGASQGTRGSDLIEDALAAVAVAADNAGGGPVLVASVNGSDGVALALLERKKVVGACLINPSASDPARWSDDVWVVVAEPLPSETRARVILVPHAGGGYLRNLPTVGKAVVSCLSEAATSQKH